MASDTQKAVLYDELVHALELSVGCMGALVKAAQADERATVTFTGDFTRLGSVTLGEVADLTNVVLGKVALLNIQTIKP